MQESPLFVEERHAQIVEHLERHRKAAVAELCERFGVSGATMRNDLRSLENAGLITRTHGGAMKKTKTGLELDSLAKEVQHRSEKREIARVALSLIEDGDTLVLDTGTTVLELARLMGDRSEVTVITNDLAIALVLEEFAGITIVFMGGVVRNRFHCTVAYGDSHDPYLSTIRVDKAFMGTNSFSLSEGATTPDLATAHAKRSMIAMASTVVLLSDSTKFERTSFARFATVDDIDVIVTDNCSKKTREALSARGVDVLCVPAAEQKQKTILHEEQK